MKKILLAVFLASSPAAAQVSVTELSLLNIECQRIKTQTALGAAPPSIDPQKCASIEKLYMSEAAKRQQQHDADVKTRLDKALGNQP